MTDARKEDHFIFTKSKIGGIAISLLDPIGAFFGFLKEKKLTPLIILLLALAAIIGFVFFTEDIQALPAIYRNPP